MHVVLQTDRLYLRRFVREDAPLLHALDSDPEVMRHISKGVPTSLACIRKEVLPRWLAYYDDGEAWGYWAAHERASDAFVGWMHLRPDRETPEIPELGYRLRRAVWGRGYATELSCALVERAFAQGAEAVCASTLVGNRASRRVMEKCGLRLERAFVYPERLLPGWTEDERRAVRYVRYRGT